jgi:hypothetical protein
MFGRIDLVPYDSAKSELSRRLDEAALARPEIDRPLSKMALETLLLKVGERAGLRNVGPHMLRRSFATHLHDHGASLEAIQKLLGHTHITTTARYTRLSTGRLAKTFERCHPRMRMNGQDGPGRSQESAKTQEATDRPYFPVRFSSPCNNVGESSPQAVCAIVQFNCSVLVCLFIRSSLRPMSNLRSKSDIRTRLRIFIMRRRLGTVKSLFLLAFP